MCSCARRQVRPLATVGSTVRWGARRPQLWLRIAIPAYNVVGGQPGPQHARQRRVRGEAKVHRRNRAAIHKPEPAPEAGTGTPPVTRAWRVAMCAALRSSQYRDATHVGDLVSCACPVYDMRLMNLMCVIS